MIKKYIVCDNRATKSRDRATSSFKFNKQIWAKIALKGKSSSWNLIPWASPSTNRGGYMIENSSMST